MNVWSLIVLGLGVRVAVLAFAIVANNYLSDHVAEGVKLYPLLDNIEYGWVSTFAKWDSAHFLTISTSGYIEEQTIAFFPLYSYAIQWVSMLLQWEARDAALVVSGLVVSGIANMISIYVLNEILVLIEKNRRKVTIAIVLFIFNPATIFFASVYSESIFALLSWLAILFAMKKYFIACCFFLMAACSARSNGTLLFVFVGFFILQLARKNYVHHEYWQALRHILIVLLSFICCSLPACVWDSYHRHIACLYFAETASKNAPTEFSALEQCLCGAELLASTSVYSYVQAKYWGVGFLNYFQVLQIPNFLLAVPVQVIACFSILTHNQDAQLLQTHRGGIIHENDEGAMAYYGMQLHIVVVALVVLLFAHVQISTRVLFSSCPLLYLSMAGILTNGPMWQKQLLIGYFIVFGVGGIILHVNFYPWT